MKYWVSLRVVRARTEAEAIEEVESGYFDESHKLCDRVIELSRIFIRPKEKNDRAREI